VHKGYADSLLLDNQWPVNFNWELGSFEPHIRGVRRLADFCLDSHNSALLVFVSTRGTVSHVGSKSLVPEAVIDVLSDDLGGYSASKLICELMLEDAVVNSGLKAALVRVGQIAGPVTREQDMWAKREWLPMVR
jgi:nucleoside-diphosphate-sugar epimerase